LHRLRIAYGGVDYLDRTRALQDGSVIPAGIDWNYVVVSGIGDLFRRMAQHAEFDAAEMSLSTYMMMISRGDTRLVAIPVFPSRAFRHNQVYVHAGAGIERPADLRGKDVGIQDYQQTAAVWVRAFLEHDYGVAPADVHWWTGGLFVPDFAERIPLKLPAGVRLDRIPREDTLHEMLETGRVQALVTTEPPPAFVRRTGTVRRLFADPRAVEHEYFRRTGYFPIMHTVVVRRDVYEANRWVARSLLEAFMRAKDLGRERLAYQGAYAVGLPWLAAELEEAEELFGGDPFAYGYKTNLPILEAMTAYAFEQGLTERKLTPDELFAPESLQDPIPG
jgi:4,5-dihydroxyphthalate decarboxylase